MSTYPESGNLIWYVKDGFSLGAGQFCLVKQTTLHDLCKQFRNSCQVHFHLLMTVYTLAYHHRLRGSASTVLTATGQVNGRWRILTPHRIETHEPTATKFRTYDYAFLFIYYPPFAR